MVQEWESLKSSRELLIGQHERIPEADLRNIVAGQYHGVKPEEVTWDQIANAAVELCRHYESFQIIPGGSDRICVCEREIAVCNLDSEPCLSEGSRRRIPQVRRRSECWVRCDMAVVPRLLGFSHRWRHRFASSRVPAAIQIVGEREAAKGLGGRRTAESWIDWLDLLRCDKDEDTGKFLYAKNTRGSRSVSEREYDRMIQAGEDIPSDVLIEFALMSDGGIEKRRYWDESTATIENLFRNSANQCLKLRSLAPHAESIGPESKPSRNADGPLTSNATEPSRTALPTVSNIEVALNGSDRKKAVELRCRLDPCNITELWTSAFQSRRGKDSTKRAAFNRWRASLVG